jgi:chitin synthase
MGYISVLAGQLCLSRSDSVWMDMQVKYVEGAEESKSTVVKNYLRGLTKLGPFESNMYLAEDRILAMEIVFQQDSPWEVGYTPQASGTIDSCETWNELLCQRRRWICSGLSCRLWLFTRIMEYVKSRNRSFLQKSRIFLASFFHLCYFVGQWVAPAFTVMIFTSLHRLSMPVLMDTPFQIVGNIAYFAVMTLLLMQLAISATGRLNVTTERFFSVSIKSQSAYLVITSILAVVGNTKATLESLLFFVAVISGVLGLAIWYARDISKGMAKSIVGYFVSRPAVAFLLITHSALNSHNTSWGTKGLNRPGYLDDIVESREAGLKRKRQFDWFRVKTVLLMLAANMLFYVMAEKSGWIASVQGLQIVAGLLSVQLAMAIIAKAYLSVKLPTSREVRQCADRMQSETTSYHAGVKKCQ